ncbi:MAG: hypothetical protein LBP62_05145 [Clostridiales bacterium]|jgi:hypothetical protein|nr:hypothetical protein [Clostridiales bacterium]
MENGTLLELREQFRYCEELENLRKEKRIIDDAVNEAQKLQERKVKNLLGGVWKFGVICVVLGTLAFGISFLMSALSGSFGNLAYEKAMDVFIEGFTWFVSGALIAVGIVGALIGEYFKRKGYEKIGGIIETLFGFILIVGVLTLIGHSSLRESLHDSLSDEPVAEIWADAAEVSAKSGWFGVGVIIVGVIGLIIGLHTARARAKQYNDKVRLKQGMIPEWVAKRDTLFTAIKELEERFDKLISICGMPREYADMESLNSLIGYFENHRVESLKDGINLLISERKEKEKGKEILEKLKSIM